MLAEYVAPELDPEIDAKLMETATHVIGDLLDHD